MRRSCIVWSWLDFAEILSLPPRMHGMQRMLFSHAHRVTFGPWITWRSYITVAPTNPNRACQLGFDFSQCSCCRVVWHFPASRFKNFRGRGACPQTPLEHGALQPLNNNSRLLLYYHPPTSNFIENPVHTARISTVEVIMSVLSEYNWWILSSVTKCEDKFTFHIWLLSLKLPNFIHLKHIINKPLISHEPQD